MEMSNYVNRARSSGCTVREGAGMGREQGEKSEITLGLTQRQQLTATETLQHSFLLLSRNCVILATASREAVQVDQSGSHRVGLHVSLVHSVHGCGCERITTHGREAECALRHSHSQHLLRVVRLTPPLCCV